MNALRAVLVAAALAAAAPAGAQVTGPLPNPPPNDGRSASLIFDAMLAISRATLANPQAAQNATFDYTRAVQQYRSGNLSAADAAAIQAIIAAQRLPARPAAVPTPVPLAGNPLPPRLAGGLPPGANPAQIDAEAFLAFSRDALATCPAGALPAARTAYADAVTAYRSGQYQTVRTQGHAVVDGCASRRAGR